MKKIEKLNQYHEQWYYMDKINELCDAVNKLYEWTGGFEQTQEPDMCNRCGFIHTKEEGCPKPTLKEPEMNGHWVVDQGGNKFWATDHKKEPECKHEYNSCANNERPFCGKCGRQFGDEKPAKKEKVSSENTSEKYSTKDELAEKYQAMFLENRKDCGFGTFKIPDYKEMLKMMADEARRWAVEQVEKAFYDTDEQYDGVLLDEVLARLKEAK